MPLDGIARSWTLRDVADDLGIVPVSESFLSTHKERELAKHPGCFLYRHQIGVRRGLAIGFFTSVIGAVSAFVLLAAALTTGNVTMMVVTLSAVAICCLLSYLAMMAAIHGRMRPPARWVESIPQNFDAVPAPLAAIANEIMEHMTRTGVAYPVIGQLVRESVVLDPYLVLRSLNDEVIVGVWEGETIIAGATRLA